MKRQNNSLIGANQLQLKAIQKFAMQWSSTHYKKLLEFIGRGVDV